MRKKIVVEVEEKKRRTVAKSKMVEIEPKSGRWRQQPIYWGGEYSNGCVARALVWYRDRGRDDDDDDALSWRDVWYRESRAPKKNPAARGDVEEWGEREMEE